MRTRVGRLMTASPPAQCIECMAELWGPQEAQGLCVMCKRRAGDEEHADESSEDDWDPEEYM